jgi:hypothetical protein
MAGDTVDVEAFDPSSLGSDIYLASLDLEVRPDDPKLYVTAKSIIRSSAAVDSVLVREERNPRSL